VTYPPYPSYKPSGVAWLGDVPVGWEVKRLKYVANRTDEKVEADEENPMPYIGLENIASWTGKLLPLDPDIVPSGAANRFRGGATLFGKLRPYLAKACNVDFEGICSTEILVLRPDHYNRGFLLYCLLSPGFISLVDSSTYGVKMPRAGWDFIGTSLLPVPPGEEQHAIADFLDRQTGKIDTLIAKRRALIEKLKEKRSALISRTVTRGLPPDAALAAGLDPHPPLKPSGVEWLGDVPMGWEVKRLKYLGSIRYGLGEPPEYTDNGLPFIRATDIDKGKIDLEKVKRVNPEDVPWSRNPQLKIHEILLVRSGAYTGDSAIVTSNVADCIAGYDMVLSVTAAHPQFIAWVLLSKYMLQGQIYMERLRAAQPHLNAEELGGFTVLTPPLPEQRAIADFLDRQTGRIDRMVSLEEAVIDRLQEYRSALITAAVTGKIDVRGRAEA